MTVPPRTPSTFEFAIHSHMHDISPENIDNSGAVLRLCAYVRARQQGKVYIHERAPQLNAAHGATGVPWAMGCRLSSKSRASPTPAAVKGPAGGQVYVSVTGAGNHGKRRDDETETESPEVCDG